MTIQRFTLIIISAFIISCNQDNTEKQNTDVVISGKVKSLIDTLKIENFDGDIMHIFNISDNNTFRDTINIPEGYYRLTHNDQQSEFYVRPNYDLNLNFDARNIDKTIRWKGKGSIENNYIAKRTFLENKLINLSHYSYYITLEESDFLKLNDSIYNLKKELFETHRDNFDNRFSTIEDKNLKYKSLNKIASYPWMKRMFIDKDFKVSENYPNVYKNINLNDEDILVSVHYLLYITNYLDSKKTSRIEENDSLDSVFTILEEIDKYVQNQKVKNELSYYMMRYRLERTMEPEKSLEKYVTMTTNETDLREIRQKFEQISGLKKGSKSPDFELENIDGKIVSLSNFQGKIVYIDLWATWCKPCLEEFSHLESLKEDFKKEDIAFISICKDDKKENWRKMVSNEKLSGIQLFAPNDDISILRNIQ